MQAAQAFVEYVRVAQREWPQNPRAGGNSLGFWPHAVAALPGMVFAE
jgi:hypothetical protein